MADFRREYGIEGLRTWTRSHSWHEFIMLVAGLSAESRFARLLSSQSKSSGDGKPVRRITSSQEASDYFDTIG